MLVKTKTRHRSIGNNRDINVYATREEKISDTDKIIKKEKVIIPLYQTPKDGIEKEKQLLVTAKNNMNRHPGPYFHQVNNKILFSNAAVHRGMTIITHNILLGSREDASDHIQLQDYGVTHVLNTAQQVPNYHPNRFIYKKLPLIDSNEVPIVEYFPSAASFLQHVECVGGRVLIHCVAGVSRSVTLLIMYMIAVHNFDLKTAYDFILCRRSYICPNDGFKYQMALFELQQLGGSSVANDVGGKTWDFFEWNRIKNSVPRKPDRPSRRPGDGGGTSLCIIM